MFETLRATGSLWHLLASAVVERKPPQKGWAWLCSDKTLFTADFSTYDLKP